jgi:FKBP-type peptidyl-prolyl cis-trans isomerase
MAINSDIQQQVFDLLSKASNLSFVSTDQEADARIGLALSPGQRVTAQVLTTLTNNRVQVQIGTERINLELPMAVRPGQNLEMTFVSAEPRSTFAIARQGITPPPVSLSDASRLLGLMVGDERSVDPGLRVSLQSVSDMLRRSSGEAGVLANLMDEALVYSPLHQDAKASAREVSGTPQQQVSQALTQDQTRLAAFESNAAQILQHIARNSRFILAEAINQPVVPLPLMPGQEVDAAVIGTLPGNRAFVSVAGIPLELILPRNVQAHEILRLTFISSQPTPLFAIARSIPEAGPGTLSEAGRWLSVLEHNQGGVSNQQMFVLERLNTVLKSLPPDSPVFAVIKDEAVTYHNILQSRQPAEQSTQVGAATITPQQNGLQQGNGIVLSDDMAKLLQALIKGNRLALLEAINQQALPSGFSPGQQLKGEVMAALGGGRFMLQVAGQNIEFSLPKGTARGDKVNLFFVSNDPQPMFLLARFGGAGDARVSDTGRWLSGFLGGTAGQMPAQATMGILRTLLSESPVDSTQVGRQLQQGLRESGLFYESHLARWFGGDFPLEDLLREPQGKLSHLKQPAVILQPAALQTEELARATMKTGSLEVMEAMVKRAGMNQSQDGLADQRVGSVVHEQLTALQNGQVQYRGDLFPGQQMEWSVREREARRNKEGGQERSWDTALEITLPKLGAISARLRLDGDRVSIDIRAGESTSVEVLNTMRPKLVEQLQAAGLAPGEIGIKHDAP